MVKSKKKRGRPSKGGVIFYTNKELKQEKKKLFNNMANKMAPKEGGAYGKVYRKNTYDTSWAAMKKKNEKALANLWNAVGNEKYTKGLEKELEKLKANDPPPQFNTYMGQKASSTPVAGGALLDYLVYNKEERKKVNERRAAKNGGRMNYALAERQKWNEDWGKKHKDKHPGSYYKENKTGWYAWD